MTESLRAMSIQPPCCGLLDVFAMCWRRVDADRPARRASGSGRLDRRLTPAVAGAAAVVSGGHGAAPEPQAGARGAAAPLAHPGGRHGSPSVTPRRDHRRQPPARVLEPAAADSADLRPDRVADLG